MTADSGNRVANVDESIVVGRTRAPSCTCTSHGDDARQGRILARAAGDVVAGRLRPIGTTTLQGLTPEAMRAAHTLVESGRSVGKTVITL